MTSRQRCPQTEERMRRRQQHYVLKGKIQGGLKGAYFFFYPGHRGLHVTPESASSDLCLAFVPIFFIQSPRYFDKLSNRRRKDRSRIGFSSLTNLQRKNQMAYFGNVQNMPFAFFSAVFAYFDPEIKAFPFNCQDNRSASIRINSAMPETGSDVGQGIA